MGYWQKESEFGKKVGCFKASLGSLGLKLLSLAEKKHLLTLIQNSSGSHIPDCQSFEMTTA